MTAPSPQFAPSPFATLPDATAAAAWLRACGARALVADHRRVQPGDAFLAWPGASHDGRRHLAAAEAAGAVACLVEAEGAEALGCTGPSDRPRAALRGLQAAAGGVADAFHGQPSATLPVVAVTGTNGKTSSALWIAQALAAAGRPCGVVGTLGVGRPEAMASTGLTTPDALTLHGALKRFVDEGLQGAAIEASSIGIVTNRLAGVRLRVAAFTNLTQDHLDFHGTMAAYAAAKRALFDWPGLPAAVLNVDDPVGRDWAAELAGRAGLDLWTVSLDGPAARLRATAWQPTVDGLAFELTETTPAGQALRRTVRAPVAGEFNARNLLGVLAVLRALGLSLDESVAAAAHVRPAPGRLEPVTVPQATAGPAVLVDYAHTPDALQQVLRALRPLAQARGGRLWCVFGCGGDRDAGKRPVMGAHAAALADQVVLTSDNPRSESPAHILAQILAGIARRDHVDVLEDRGEAIAHAIGQAAPNDVVLLAGKGHESTQEIAGESRPFSDLDQARRALAARGAAA